MISKTYRKCCDYPYKPAFSYIGQSRYEPSLRPKQNAEKKYVNMSHIWCLMLECWTSLVQLILIKCQSFSWFLFHTKNQCVQWNNCNESIYTPNWCGYKKSIPEPCFYTTDGSVGPKRKSKQNKNMKYEICVSNAGFYQNNQKSKAYRKHSLKKEN